MSYNSIGKANIRLKNFSEAKTWLEKGLNISKEIGSVDNIKESYGGLESLDSAMGNYKEAYDHSKLYTLYRDSLFNQENTKKSVQIQMNYDFEKKEAIAKAEKDKKDIRQRNIRNSILAGLGGMFVFSLIIFRQRNKISKEKKRSEELLLNILPSETAEELKQTGSARAKSYEEVTVMFTDFKDFTQASEKLSAEELVKEINYCYSEFDKIISGYKVEKIKTIGDSYMCAGGLPVPNKTNAEDTVRAALGIQQFMEQLRRQREQQGRPFFELRIGVHTGPVVAGIVGIKKFAYDIWGDTVNIASRMQSSGEVGKVNISEATFELVRDKFQCSYRGKIQAKHKGEIDMYFVN
jgi:class 3 adenylate cyclase